MSLLRLLTVGRSLGAVRDQPSRYKMTQQSLLPKFGAVGQPTGGEAPTVESGLKPVPSPTVETKATPKAAIESPAAKEKRTKVMTTVETEFPAVSASDPSAPKQAFPAGRWTIFRNPFGSATARPKALRAPVQGELSLDAVKPVRNDLSDSDLEVIRVSRSTTAGTTGAPPVVSAPPVELDRPPEPAGPVWDRLKTQFFGAGKT
jgi:hypothetical protein